MTAMDSIEAKLNEYETLLKLQMAKIEELVAENERLTSALGAHTVLKSIYSDPNQPTVHRIKAAGLALGHEVPKLQSVPPALDLVAEEVIPLAELVTQRRARQRELEGRDIEVTASGAVRILPKPGSNGGNGADDSDQS
jgi:hypothetical protein